MGKTNPGISSAIWIRMRPKELSNILYSSSRSEVSKINKKEIHKPLQQNKNYWEAILYIILLYR